jgi:hypothetical protein
MSTVRIQVRRGTAAQWASVNPILAAGEMGVESDTNLFKFGNGSSTWTALAYANNSDVAIGEISQDAINTALTMGAGLSKTYNDGANTITINVDSNVVALKSYVDAQVSGLANTVDTDYIPLSDRGVAGGVAALDNTGKVPANQLNISETIQDVIGSTLVSGRGSNVAYNDANDTLTLTAGLRGQGSVSVTNATDNNDLIVKLNPVVAADTKFTGPLVEVGTVTSTNVNATNVTISGDLTVNGTTTTVNSTNVTIDDPMIYIGDNNQSNALDLGVVAAFNNGTYQHSGLVRDASDGKWKLFSGVIAEPTTTVDFTTYTKDSLEIGGLHADSARIGNVSNEEIQHLDGVGWPIQGQINEKLNISTAASTYAPIASPMFTGTVTLPEGTVTSRMIANGTITNEDIGTFAEIAQSKVANLVANLAEKATTHSPTLTGTVVLPGTTSIGSVSATEIGYLDGVTSSIQTQLAPVQGLVNSVYALESDLNTAENTISSLESSVGSINTTTTSLQTQINTKASTASLTAHEADTTNIHGIADTSVLATATTVATAKSEAIAAAGTAADTKVSTAVAALTKSSVGLANVDNTSDANKPVSTATTTALALKANLAGPTFTGTVTLPSTTSIGDVSATELGYLDGVTSSIQTQLTARLPLAGGTMTGALTLSGAPTSDLHAATKQYVDGVSAGIHFHKSVRIATATNWSAVYANGTNGYGATLTASVNQSINPADGVTLAVGDRILVKSQTDAKQNGIYDVTSLGSSSSKWVLTRSADSDNNPNGEVAGGDFTFVTEGSTNASIGFILSSPSGTATIGTDNLVYAQFNAAQAINAGSGLTKTGSTLSIETGAITSAMILDGAIVDADVNASAAIAQSKISGLTSDLSAKAPLANPTFTGTVTVAASGIAFTDGTQTKVGVPSITTIATAISSSSTLAAGEADKFVPLTGAVQITLPATGYSTGQSIDFYQASGTGASFASTNGVVGTPGLKFRTTNSVVTALKISSGWLVFGDLSA